jgi:RNA polymerase-binding protein DksA
MAAELGPAVPGRKRRQTILNEEQRAHFRELLLSRKAMVIGDLHQMASEALKGSGGDSSSDNMADHGTDNYEQDFTLGLIENEEALLREIEEALTRLDLGTFGACEECRGGIPMARLETLPFARFCVSCQQLQEKAS